MFDILARLARMAISHKLQFGMLPTLNIFSNKNQSNLIDDRTLLF